MIGYAKLLYVLIKNELRENAEYKLDFFIGFVWSTIGIIPMYFVWKLIKAYNQAVPYSTFEILVYLFFAISLFYGVGWLQVYRSVKTGDVANKAVRPLDLSIYYSMVFFSSIVSFQIFAIILVLIGGTILFGINAILSIFFYLLGLIFGSLIVSILVALGFWLYQVDGVAQTINYTINIVSGSILPLDLYPSWAKKVIMALPFKLMFFVPIKVLLGHIKPSFYLLIQYIFWILVAYGLAKILYYFGLRRYEQLGG